MSAGRAETGNPMIEPSSASTPPSEPDPGGMRPQPAAKGVLFLSVAQGAIVAFGYLVHFVAARKLPQESYGQFVVVLSVLGWLRVLQGMLLVTGFRKVVSEDHRRLGAALTVGARYYAVVSAALFIVYLADIPLIAYVFGERAPARLLLIAGLEIPFAAVLILSRLLLGAVRQYVAVAASLMLYAGVRAGAAVALLILGLGPAGPILGEVIASAVAGALALTLCLRANAAIPAVAYPPLMRRAVMWTALELPGNLGLRTLASVDLWMLAALVQDSSLVGLYGTAYAFSRLPQFLFTGMVTAVFPRVSGALAEGKRELARSVSRQAVRLLMLVLVPACFIVASSSSEILTLLFSSRYASGGSTLAILMAAMSCSGCLLLLCELLAAADRLGKRLSLVVVLLPLSLALNALLIPRWGLTGAATASLATFAVGVAAGAALAQRHLDILPSPWTLLRCLGASGLSYGIGLLWPAEGMMLVVKLAALGALYVAALLLMGEVTREDWKHLAGVVARDAGRQAAEAGGAEARGLSREEADDLGEE
ncbi:MAG: oligosaccharide flippase family protein [Planctomycetota bacterium]